MHNQDSEPSRFIAYHGDAIDVYGEWDRPDLIVSDGAYGVRGFDGDPPDPHRLPDWYAPHVRAWSERARSSSSLWFWNTEVGWASVHPLLESEGWDYVQTVVWDKGLSHVAGNVNGNTIRQFPVVTEVSVLYRRRIELPDADGNLVPVREWLRSEWERSGLPLYRANEACGVRNAASRKYLARDWRWYWPPGSMVERMASFASEHGRETDRPYFSIDGSDPVTADGWDALRPVWNHRNGLTNVWSRPPLHGSERMRESGPRSRAKSVHLNQKPLDLIRRQVEAVTSIGGVVWEPFGGLATASVAAVQSGRFPYMAETDERFFETAVARLEDAARGLAGQCPTS